MAKVPLQAIDKNLPGGANMGGIPQTVFAAYWDDVLTWPTEPDLATVLSLEDLASLTGSVVMKTGKCFFPIYVTDDAGEFEIEPVGEIDGKSFVEHLRIFNPGLQKKILGLMNAAKNENLVFIVPDNNGNMFLMGDKLRAAVYAASPDGMGTGKATADRAGVSMEFTYKTKNVYMYSGTVPLVPAA